MAQQVLATNFDYTALPEEHRSEVREAAVRIKVRMTRTVEDIIEIGKDLLAVKERVGHGNFGPWLDAEFGMTDRSARRFIAVAERFGTKTDAVSDLSPSVLYELAAKDTDDEVIEAALEKASTGEAVSRDDIKKLKAELKEARSEVKAMKAASEDQAAALREEVERLRRERDVAEAEGRAKPVKKPDAPLNDFEVDDLARQRLVSAWNAATSETRAWFREWIETPVMDARAS